MNTEPRGSVEAGVIGKSEGGQVKEKHHFLKGVLASVLDWFNTCILPSL